MARILISMKFSLLRNSPRGMRIAGWAVGAALVAGSWALVLAAQGDQVRTQVLALVLTGWAVAAAIGPVTMSGAGVLRPEYFTLLPLDPRRLPLGLLASTFTGVAAGYVLLTALSLTWHAGAAGGGSARGAALVATVAVALVVAGLFWVIAISTSRVVYSVLGAAMRTRFGIELSGLQFGLLVAALIAGWTVIASAFQTVPELLRSGIDGTAATVLLWLPWAWPVRAVDAAATGSVLGAVAWIAALAALAAVVVLATVRALRPSGEPVTAVRRRRRLGSRVLTSRPILPTTALGAVIGKELRQWWRDPWRALELRTAVYTGLFISLFAMISTAEYRAMAPLGGIVIAFMIALAGCNLYGQDGTALWMSVVGQRADTVRAEVRGRQLALVILFVPVATVLSALIVLVTRQWWAWPLVIGLLPALFGVASGLAVLLSVLAPSPGVDPRRRNGPNDAGGDMSLQAQVAFWGTVLLVAPTIAAGVFAVLGRWGEHGWWVVATVGLLNGLLGWWGLGRLAVSFLTDRLPTLYTRVRYRRNEDPGSGVLAGFAAAAQKGEDAALAAKEKQKQAKAKARAGR